MKKINFILNQPNIFKLKVEDKNIIWKYRYYLKNNTKALIKFLRSVKWKHEKYRIESLNLLDAWEPIEYEDSIFLLSSVFSNNDIYESEIYNIEKDIRKQIICKIRSYAIFNMKKLSKDKINFIILQLVHSLRYEEYELISCNLFNFLIENCLNDIKLSIYFYWNLEVEKSNDIIKVRKWFIELKNKFFLILKENKPDFYNIIENQIKFRNEIINIFNNKIKNSNEKLDGKRIKFRKIIDKSDYFKNLNLTLINPDYKITSINPKNCSIFGSNTSPMLLDFGLNNDKNYKIIFKSGDDMRQDLLILKFISIIDYLLKNMNVDLRLTIYDILVLTKDDGLMECVPNCQTLQKVLKENNDDLNNYFKKISLENNINYDKIIDNYIESTAAYCVITYILGIGDRHLENLMIDNLGRLFHIDFGYSMGEDPKPFNPPIKLDKKMVLCLGWKDGEKYKIFVMKCVTYFLYIRKNSDFLLNLLYLMIHSNLVINPGKNKVLSYDSILKIAERLLLNKKEIDVEIIFKKIIKICIEAIITGIWDKLHSIMSYLK